MSCESKGLGLLPNERPVFVKAFSANEIGPGRELRCEFGNIPSRDAHGRYGYLVGFYLTGNVVVDTDGTQTGAFPGWKLFGQLGTIRLRAGGVDYLDGRVDGRDLRFDTVKRFGSLLIPDPSDVPDAVATEVETSFGLLHRFAGFSRDRIDNAIPLPLLNHRENADDILSITPQGSAGSDLAVGAQASTGIVLDATPYTDFVLYAIVRYEERPVAPAGWLFTGETTVLTQGAIEAPPGDASRLAYAYVYPHDEDGSTIGSFGNWTIQAGGDVMHAAISTARLLGLESALRAMGTLTDVETESTPSDMVNAAIPIVNAMVGRPVSEMARGPVLWDTTAISGTVRILHRHVRPMTKHQLDMIANGWKVGTAEVVPQATRDVHPGLLNRLLVPR